MTLVELLVSIAVGTIVLVPLFGLLNLTLRQRGPAVERAEVARELRLFRSALSDDWAEGRVVRVNPTDPVGFELNCNGGGNQGGAENIKIAIRKSAENRRVLYKLTPVGPANAADGPFQLLRSECTHSQGPPPLNLWGFGSTDGGSTTQVVASKVAELRLPETCNPEYEPFSPCDMNVTLVMANGDRTTLRLHQSVGRRS